MDLVKYVVLSTVAIISILIIGIYRLFYHELARFPGPFLAKLSTIPNWRHACAGDRHLWLLQLHERYGPIVRYTPNSLSFNTASAVETIYGNAKANVMKGDWYQCVQDSAGGHESTFTARNKGRHAIKRRMLSQAFSERALRDYLPRVNAVIRSWLDNLEVEIANGHYIDLGLWSSILMFDILGDLCFGRPFGLLDSNDLRYLIKLVNRTTGGWYTLGYNPVSKILRYMLFKTRLGHFLGGWLIRDNQLFREFCMSRLKERNEHQSKPKDKNSMPHRDIFDYLLNAQDPETGKPLSTGDLACESVLLIVAGSHTTSVALAATIFYLAQNPKALARVELDVRGTFATESAFFQELNTSLPYLPFLTACITEALRLAPPNPGLLPRIVTSDGQMIDGEWIPCGTIVGVSMYAVHRNILDFPEPGLYKPERWLKGDKYCNTQKLQAFSAGATGCIGKQLAHVEIRQALAALVLRFNLTLQDQSGKHGEFHIVDKFVAESDGPTVGLVPHRHAEHEP